MSIGCYKYAGEPKIYNEQIKKAVDLIRQIYQFSDYGGNLHTHINDYNLTDSMFKRKNLLAYDKNVSPEQLKAERSLYRVLREMSEVERISAVALYDGFWSLS